MLHAYTLRADKKYVRSARLFFEDLLRLAERNPHGYFPAWSLTPGADKYDTVYNPVSYDRGITSIWYEEARDRIGRESTSRFVAAQARWFVFSGQLLDTLETDNVTAIRACNHGAHTNLRNQIGIYLYDDFRFYRGLIGDLVAWSAASDQVPEKVDRSGTGPYRGLILSNAGSSMVRWGLNIRPGGKWLEFRVQPLARRNGFRLEVTREADKLLLKVSKPAKFRLHCRELCPDWPADVQPVLHLRQADGRVLSMGEDVAWDKGTNQWQVAPGVYELAVP